MVCVATEYGRTLQEEHPGAKTLTGRLDAPAMEKVLEGAALCVDATHPYAREASRNIVVAAKKTSVPYKRLVRPKSLLPDKCQMVESATEAARVLEKTTGNILLTTGVKELGAFSRLNPNRLFPRVLPSRESIRLCEEKRYPAKPYHCDAGAVFPGAQPGADGTVCDTLACHQRRRCSRGIPGENRGSPGPTGAGAGHSPARRNRRHLG